MDLSGIEKNRMGNYIGYEEKLISRVKELEEQLDSYEGRHMVTHDALYECQEKNKKLEADNKRLRKAIEHYINLKKGCHNTKPDGSLWSEDEELYAILDKGV